MIDNDAWSEFLNDLLPLAGILVVDDHGIVREGLIALLGKQEGIQVLGSAASGAEAIAVANRVKPDIVIMDLLLPDMSGIDVTERILEVLPLTRIIVLSACRTIEHVYRSLRAGARGYLVKDAVASDLIHAVRAVRSGKQFLSPSVMPPTIDTANCFSMSRSPLERLSVREREVLRRIVDGASSAVIAQHLSLSRKTIDTYRGRLMAKLGVCNRSALIRFAIENEFTV